MPMYYDDKPLQPGDVFQSDETQNLYYILTRTNYGLTTVCLSQGRDGAHYKAGEVTEQGAFSATWADRCRRVPWDELPEAAKVIALEHRLAPST